VTLLAEESTHKAAGLVSLFGAIELMMFLADSSLAEATAPIISSFKEDSTIEKGHYEIISIRHRPIPMRVPCTRERAKWVR
jgi:hypothetical protein